jgi:hypothetical protein
VRAAEAACGPVKITKLSEPTSSASGDDERQADVFDKGAEPTADDNDIPCDCLNDKTELVASPSEQKDLIRASSAGQVSWHSLQHPGFVDHLDALGTSGNLDFARRLPR